MIMLLISMVCMVLFFMILPTILYALWQKRRHQRGHKRRLARRLCHKANATSCIQMGFILSFSHPLK